VAVYVAPMREGSGIKNKVLEAMAAGLPVVSTPLGVNGIGAGPGVVVAGTADEMASAAAALLADPDEAARVGAAGRRRVVAELTWTASVDAVDALWHEVVAARSRTR
jgi:glycosyltransferase involved in cell wall biosynthesis